MNYKEQKAKVLEMLKEGKINQNEALDLLELIGSQKEQEVQTSPVQMVVPEAPLDFFGNGQQSFSISQEVVNSQINLIKLIGKNSKVSVRTHKGSTIEINGWYKPMRNSEAMINFEEQNNSYVLNYNFHGVKYLGFDICVPETMIDTFYVENSNAEINVLGTAARQLTVMTKNANIMIEHCHSQILVASTKNSYIDLRKVEGKKIELTTTNANINVKNLTCEHGEFITKNAEITIQDSQIIRSNVQSKNAKIWLDLSNIEFDNEVKNYQIEGRTTNANIEIFLPREKMVPFKINGSTKRGRINTEGQELTILASDKGYLNAKSQTYDHSKVTLDLDFQTTNGNINVKGY